MKKFICILLCIILIVPFSAVYAAEGVDDSEFNTSDLFDPTGFFIGSAECEFGGTAKLDLTVSQGFSFAVAAIKLNYDANAIKLINVTSDYYECDFTVNDTGATVTLIDFDNTASYTDAVAQFEFASVNKSGEFTVEGIVNDQDVSDASGNAVSAYVASGTLTVSCEHYLVYTKTKEPTCAEQGQVIYTCRLCNSESITYLDKIDHTSGPWEVTKQPDCDETGVNTHFCEVCREVLETTSIKELGHAYGEIYVDKAPTCTEKGVSVRFCSVCDHEDYGEIEALGHKNASWKTSSPAGCGEQGVVSLVCDDCSLVLETKTTDATGHLMDWVITKPASCAENGEKAYLCVVCGFTEETETIEKKEHIQGETVITKYPTCDTTGQSEVRCNVCDEVIKTETLKETGHIKKAMTVITAPTDTATGTAVYNCFVCGEKIEDVVLEKTNAFITAADKECFTGNTIRIPVSAKNNKGFSAGLIKVSYSTKDLVYLGVDGLAVTDLTVAKPAAGKLNILMCPNVGNVTSNGVLFYLVFEVTSDAEDSVIDITYDAEGGFSDEDGNFMFFNVSGCKITVVKFKPGDVNQDGVINTTDLAMLKKIIAGLETETETSDVDSDGKITTSDLALLKKYVAGLVSEI